MDRNFIHVESSAWWIVVILLVAAAFSWFHYSKRNVPWNSSQNWVLALLRFLASSLILLLLLSPSLRRVTNTVEPPVVALIIDDSQSVVGRNPDKESVLEIVETMVSQLSDDAIEVAVVSLSDSLNFNATTTNLNQLIKKAEKQLEDRNLKTSVLLSDGIFNSGSSPLYSSYLHPIYTLGAGDTIPPRDVSISRTQYNKVTFKDNETPIRLEIRQDGYDNRSILIRLTEKGVPIEQKNVRLTSSIQEVEFILPLPEEGLRHLVATVDLLEGESTNTNNVSNIFMEVIDGRQKVLLVAQAPHPDVKAIRSALNKTGNYEADVYIPEINDEKPSDSYDVVIFHGAFASGINYTPKGNPGIWYILSNESSIVSSNRALPYLDIERRGARPDKVAGAFNQNFSKFKIDEVSAFEDYPPIEVPFGNYKLSGPVEVLMYQKLGSVTTNKPLMVVYDDGATKSAALMGQNIWQWKLQEAALRGEANQFENFITKTIQFLAVSNDKKQFRFAPRSTSFSNLESVVFDAEVYNDIYERIYGNDIAITITSESGEEAYFDFTDSEYNATFRSPVFNTGIYRYEATTQFGNKQFAEKGEFLVRNINREYLDLTANHRLLKNLANKTGGSFASMDNWQVLLDALRSQEWKASIKSEENLTPLFRAWWWYFAIFLLFSVEWFLRKYWGAY